MAKNQVFQEMKKYYGQTGKVMNPHVFQSQFSGTVSAQEATLGILMFDQYLDSGVRRHGATG
ncbi:hypothetical protein [Priestia aryabhattai]|uniref:hypothetical protein n=1 Tax=Priestia aryabhattai TaxID=412384 RepID=UPI002380B61C|nr:hypothetical protein [Priestia aryabhattai]WDW09383.1 hypothetical protein PWC21_02045 [Priestia aryabhattai]